MTNLTPITQYTDYLVNYGMALGKLQKLDTDMKRGDVEHTYLFRTLTQVQGKVLGTDLKPLRLHASYMIQQVTSSRIQPYHLNDLMLLVDRNDHENASDAIHMLATILEDPCGRSMFHIYSQNGFDDNNEHVITTLENRRKLVDTGHNRVVEPKYIDQLIDMIYAI